MLNMIIETPSKYLNNIFAFYNIFLLSNKEKKVCLFVTTIEENIDNQKLDFCISVLKKLGIDVKVIIDKKIPDYYENILFTSKIVGDLNIDSTDFDFNNIFETIERKMITYIDAEDFIFSKPYANYRYYETVELSCDNILEIKKIVSNEKNIDILLSIAKVFGLNDDEYKENYKKLKMDLIDCLSSICIYDYVDISDKIQINKILNKEINFRRDV